MKRAADIKDAKTRQLMQQASSQTKIVESKQELRLQKQQDAFIKEFERNVVKRTEIEKRRKKRQEEKQADVEYTAQEKREKEIAIKMR